jgi:hypothetical protein
MNCKSCIKMSWCTRMDSNLLLSKERQVSRGITPDLNSMFDQITFQRFEGLRT